MSSRTTRPAEEALAPAPVPALPVEGGSFIRQPDGTLTREQPSRDGQGARVPPKHDAPSEEH